MQKVVELLEKHVQWVALGLGVVWLLLMTWTYVINPPAEVTIGSETLRSAYAPRSRDRLSPRARPNVT
jgi:hypothetical protein